jgi:TonB family protein
MTGMLAELLALFAAAAPAAPVSVPPSKTVSPVTVTATPSTEIEKHPDATINSVGGADDAHGGGVAIWPRRAYVRGTSGRVTLSCLVDAHGLAEWCRVAAEEPTGQGFGRAALEMRPTFKLTPVQGADGKPITALMTVNVGFKAPATEFDSDGAGVSSAANRMGAAPTVSGPTHGARIEMHPVVMIDNPVWAAAASFDDLARAYPAKAGGVDGYVAAHCQVDRSGRDAGALHGCQIIKEAPTGKGFDQAALSLMPKFRLLPSALARAPSGPPLWVDVPVRFSPATFADRTVAAPVWLRDNDAAAAPVVYPKEAAAQGVTTGRGIARCTVAADGKLSACAPETAEPDGLGFSEAAVKLASAMRVNLWSADGAPVEGGVVHVPIRLNLSDGGD